MIGQILARLSVLVWALAGSVAFAQGTIVQTFLLPLPEQ